MSGYTSIYVANPTSVLTRPADTSAYAQNDLIASSTTAASVVVPSVQGARAANHQGTIIRVRLNTNITTGFSAATFTVRLWSAAPTYTNGDNGAYAVATGAAGWLASFSVTLEQQADGAYGAGVPTVGNGALFSLPIDQTVIYWDLQYTAAAGVTPIASQTFTLTLEVARS
jgi:hypothetical protein